LALPEMPPVNASFIWQFFSQDIWPSALQQGDLLGTWQWVSRVSVSEVWPALWQTIAITQAALVLSGILALLYYPFASRALVGRWSVLGRFKLLVLRSVPELMLAYVFMLLFGPSALPAILALALHNGGLIAFLLANSSEDANKRIGEDVPSGIMRFAYVDLPQRYPAFLAFLFYRWEVILRESAMMGVVGIATLGFYVDSAFEEIRFDKAFFLIVVAALLNILVDALSRWLRARSGLKAPAL
jgi:phosphonate transport system permease protein